ncbi:ribonuclease H-like domain-containing protein [Tanacetum coccineum]
MSGSQDEIPPLPPPPPSQTPTQQTPHIVSTIKLPILKKGEYDIWAMKMEHYLANTDYPIWEVIQNGNGPVKGFSDINSEGLHKGYDMFQSLLSQLEIHGVGVDSLSFDDLYNNLRVFKNDLKGSTASFSSTQNVAFISENTSSTNNVSTAYGVSNPSDLEQLDEFDLKEMDLKWQVAMISMRMKKFYKKTGRKLQFDAKEPVGFDKTKVECYNCHKTGHFARECRTKGNQDSKRRDAWNSGNKDGKISRRRRTLKLAVLAQHREAEKEKEDLKAKVEKWHNSSKNLGKLLNTQMSANDKFGLGYGIKDMYGIIDYGK